MYYIVETPKSFSQASTDLEAAVIRHGFGVLHVHDLGNTLRSKGMAFEDECKVFEVCNPGQAAKVLAIDMRLNMALPCRIVTVHGAAPLSGNKSSHRIQYSRRGNRQTHRHRLFSQCLLTRLADNSVSADT